MRYSVVYEQGDTSWGAYVPDLPGCVAVGDSGADVEFLIVEAIRAPRRPARGWTADSRTSQRDGAGRGRLSPLSSPARGGLSSVHRPTWPQGY